MWQYGKDTDADYGLERRRPRELLKEYEASYHMSTLEFSVKFNRGELLEGVECMEWITFSDMAARAGLVGKNEKE